MAIKDITNSLPEFSLSKKDYACMEYIYGMRFYIQCDGDGVKYWQDEEYNLKTFGEILPEDFFTTILRKHNIGIENFKQAPHHYILHCIYYDPRLMGKFKAEYRDRGIVIVEVEMMDGIRIMYDKIFEYCAKMGLTALRPLRVGNIDIFRDKIDFIRKKSNLSKNEYSTGVLFVTHPPEQFKNEKTGKWDVVRHYLAPDENTNVFIQMNTLENMSKELVLTSFGAEKIIQLEKSTNVCPVKRRVMFKKMLLNYLQQDMATTYEAYRKRSAATPQEFEKAVKKFITHTFMNEYVLVLEPFRLRK